MAIGVAGDVVTFLITGSATTQAGVVLDYTVDTTHNLVAYDLAIPYGGRIAYCSSYITTSVTVVSNTTD